MAHFRELRKEALEEQPSSLRDRPSEETDKKERINTPYHHTLTDKIDKTRPDQTDQTDQTHTNTQGDMEISTQYCRVGFWFLSLQKLQNEIFDK